MDRRSLLAAGAALAFAAWGSPQPAQAQPSYTVSRQQLQRVLEERFPIRRSVTGLLDIELQMPRLALLPERNRVATELPIEVSGPALRRRYAGRVDVDFALRYERSDQSIRAHRIRIDAVRMEGLNPDGEQLLDAYVRQLSGQAMLEVVLHRLRPQELALAATMGFEPGEITVTPQGLAVGFVPRGCGDGADPCPR